MRILIPTLGSRGDVQPFIALAQGLERAGHAPTILSHPGMRALVEAHPIAFKPMGPDIDLGVEAAAIRARSRNPILSLVRVMGYAFQILEQSHADILAQCRHADLVVVPAASAAGRNEADLSGLAHISVTFMPWALRYHDPERPLFKQVGYGALDWVIGSITTRPLNRLRRRQGLPPVGEQGLTSPRLNLIPISSRVFPPNPHWAPQHRLTGYWFVEEPAGWQPPDELVAFLENGEPPLVVSLGAMSLGEEQARETAHLFVAAIKQAGVRAVIQGWEAVLERMDLPALVFSAGSLPHSWLLLRAAGLVHHGGFGTTAAGFRAGIPQFVIPHIADQFYWGQRVAELGVGPPAIYRTKLDASGLAAAMQTLHQEDELRHTAGELGAHIRSEDGVGEAVQIIEEVLGADGGRRTTR